MMIQFLTGHNSYYNSSILKITYLKSTCRNMVELALWSHL